MKLSYKKTEIGLIPVDWEITTIGDLCNIFGRIGFRGYTVKDIVDEGNGAIAISPSNIQDGKTLFKNCTYISWHKYEESPEIKIFDGDVILVKTASIGKTAMVKNLPEKATLNPQIIVFKNIKSNAVFFSYILGFKTIQEQIKTAVVGGVLPTLSQKLIAKFKLPLPSTQSEQLAIAKSLSDVDTLLATLDKTITKKSDLKRAAMQNLLTGKMRLPGFSGDWAVKALGEISICLDYLRVPLNETQRGKILGDYPYCGANGILGYVDDFVVDDDIILMAEDGGYFDEYETRPIAYQMTGKCWVNNHAHILKAKSGVDQGFLFYSLVHKNILPFLASGTRAKLNKSEMNKIQIKLPTDEIEQIAISTILIDIDSELNTLKARHNKIYDLKQGMMQELLTGKTRLLNKELIDA